jgi:DNA-binding GntR family transcriptional regulator
LRDAFDNLSASETRGPSADPVHWEDANRCFHEALIAAHRSPWSQYLLKLLYRHGERYRHVAIRLVTDRLASRDVHEEHALIFDAAVARREARAALALEAHIRLTYELLASAQTEM